MTTTHTVEDVIDADTRDEAEQIARDLARADLNGEAVNENEARQQKQKIHRKISDMMETRASIKLDTSRSTTQRAVAHEPEAGDIVL